MMEVFVFCAAVGGVIMLAAGSYLLGFAHGEEAERSEQVYQRMLKRD